MGLVDFLKRLWNGPEPTEPITEEQAKAIAQREFVRRRCDPLPESLPEAIKNSDGYCFSYIPEQLRRWPDMHGGGTFSVCVNFNGKVTHFNYAPR